MSIPCESRHELSPAKNMEVAGAKIVKFICKNSYSVKKNGKTK